MDTNTINKGYRDEIPCHELMWLG